MITEATQVQMRKQSEVSPWARFLARKVIMQAVAVIIDTT
jgi:hypothetical protein